MIITNNKTEYRKQQKKQPAFKSSGAVAMNYLANNQAIGATAIDLLSMVLPRVAIAYSRTPEAGEESAKREFASCALYPLTGMIGLGAAHMIMPLYKGKYGVNYSKVTANNQGIDVLAKTWKDAGDKHSWDASKKGDISREYLQELVGSLSGKDGNKVNSINNDPKLKDEIVNDLADFLESDNGYKIQKDKKTLLKNKLIKATGSSESLFLHVPGSEKIKTNADDFINDTCSMGRSFLDEKVFNEFKSAKEVKNNKFVKSLKGFTTKKMAVGLGVASFLSMTMQPFIRYMTKKKTGSDAFVVYGDSTSPAKKDDSAGFKMKKGAFASAMIALSVGTIGKIKELPTKLEFKGVKPTLSQYKLIYGLGIAGRLLAASDKNELRETATRDFLGFTSWLILGDVVAKGIARQFEKSSAKKGAPIVLLNQGSAKQGDANFVKLMKSSLKTHSEVVYSAAKRSDVDKGFKTLLKAASKETRKAVKYINIAQLGGYGVSGLVLGLGIPILNKTITNNAVKKKANKLSATQGAQKGVQSEDISFSQSKFLKNKSKSFQGSVAFSSFTQ